MTISCTNTAKENCEHRRAGLCFNPCVIRAAQAATEIARDVAEGKVERIDHMDF